MDIMGRDKSDLTSCLASSWGMIIHDTCHLYCVSPEKPSDVQLRVSSMLSKCLILRMLHPAVSSRAYMCSGMDNSRDWGLLLPALMSDRVKAAVDESHSLITAARRCRGEHDQYAERLAAHCLLSREDRCQREPSTLEVCGTCRQVAIKQNLSASGRRTCNI